MPKYWQTKSFKEIAANWEKRLKDNGFVDIETTIDDDRVLIQNASNSYRNAPRVVRENKEQYYTMVTHWMEYAPPRDRIERFVMFYLSHGAKIKEICDELKHLGGPSHRQTVRFIIRKYEHNWGIRIWDQNKLNPKWRTTHIK